MSPSLFGRAIAAILALAFAGAGMTLAERPARKLSLEELRQQRSELARRQRRIIMNNDGCDVLYFPKSAAGHRGEFPGQTHHAAGGDSS